jgi:hypothetical protein
VTVPISPAMPDTSYRAVPSLVGVAANLDNVDLIGVKSKATSSVVVTLHNTSLVAIAAGGVTVEVIAARP